MIVLRALFNVRGDGRLFGRRQIPLRAEECDVHPVS